MWRILAPALVIALLMIGLTIANAIWNARAANHAGIARQQEMARRALANNLKLMARSMEGQNVWDETVTKAKAHDLKWLDDYLGIWMYLYLGHERVYVLDDHDQPIYAMVGGSMVAPEAFSGVRPLIGGMVAEVRKRRAALLRSNPAAEGADPENDLKVFGRKATDVADVLLLDGRPMAVDVMTIVPLTNAVTQLPGTEYLQISFRPLDGGFLTDLARLYLLTGARFSRAGVAQHGEASLPLVSRNGTMIGHVLWQPELLGSRTMRALLPTAMLDALVTSGLMAALLWLLRRALKDLRISEAEASYLAFHDTLTGLPNRALFNDRLDQELARVQRSGGKLALVFLDLDGFKQINDSLGHPAGDAVLRELGVRLAELMRATDTVARLGGDEFAIMLTDVSGEEAVVASCERMMQAIRPTFAALGQVIHVGMSMGVAIAPDTGVNRDELARKADVALYSAKAEGRNCFRLFRDGLDNGVRLRQALEEDLRKALANGGEMEVFYQPQIAAETEAIVGVEALLRWHHPTRGLLQPRSFIPLAEQSGLIVPLGEWVLRQACVAAGQWPNVRMAVNVSPAQLRIAGFAALADDVARQGGIAASRIELEITESVILATDPICEENLRQLRRDGFRLALDDYGTGYSTHSLLRRLQVDRIKIDPSFVQDLGRSGDSTMLLRSLIDLGHSIGATVTAEGVETAEQKSFLVGAGCDELQGFLFAHPAPKATITALLRQHEADAVPAQ